MAEVLLRARAAERGLDLTVSSSGTWAIDGEPATEGAVEAMRTRGIDLTAHRSRPFEPDLGREVDLIVAMTSVHLREIAAALPGSSGKTRLLKELGQLETGVASGSDVLAVLLAAERPTWVRSLDLDDPMGLPFHAYEVCAAELEKGIDRILEILG